ncbi:aminoglycoside phosphotransferase [Paenibacillus albiflavus]|uniref:Aminoglycoside phosphotransferase n=1 Tax=Paenibacillus albiflavus TaxID=2545760 RepID=A0A4R4EL48_9BACL|nr:phosphotransferase [Paenibacillus albiflavus]TCZ80966.1 aminoglycoside phosphotransferase [Paenibacillus albiflavus]
MATELTLMNNTTIPIENKIDQIHACVQFILGETAVLKTITCNDLGYQTPNFTTAGIYHLHGIAEIQNKQLPWSIILKIIKPDSTEKANPLYHNYWRREALVMEARLLEELPNSIHAAQSYLVEEQPDETIWLWMEHVEGKYAYSQEQFCFIARQLGRFNGAYLTGNRSIPDYSWICNSWLKSWTKACRMYAPNPEAYVNRLNKDHERSIWSWYQEFNQQVDATIGSLEQLPRVLAHQDLSQMNMLLVNNNTISDELVLIDWQFMSISGIGEDLGKLYGVNMSLGIIPPDQYEVFQSSLFNAYLEGLRDMGWMGDERLARYGYCVSMSVRSVWEVPHFFASAAKLEIEPQNHKLKERMSRLERIISIHQKMALEADSLKEIFR